METDMAAASLTTRSGAVKAPFHALSPYARHFIVLLNALVYHIHAQGDLDRTDLSDAGYADRLEKAETEREKLYDILLDNLQMRATEPDAPLRRMSLLIATLIRGERASAFARYAALREDLAPFLHVHGDDPIAARHRDMLAAADKRISLMARLSCYRTQGAASVPELIAA
ncbi:hypothetical protein [Paracoccus aestuarii]|nr:hypothetical protein [Paracoccus aestuarii]WCQ98630.1 hypothetical protein JHW48_12130 [Paracoccus aestuarii]